MNRKEGEIQEELEWRQLVQMSNTKNTELIFYKEIEFKYYKSIKNNLQKICEGQTNFIN